MNVAITMWPVNPILGGGLFGPPPSGFSCAIVKHGKIESSYLATFSKHSLRTFRQKNTGSGQVRSPEAVVDPVSGKFVITPELEIFTDRFFLFRFL